MSLLFLKNQYSEILYNIFFTNVCQIMTLLIKILMFVKKCSIFNM